MLLLLKEDKQEDHILVLTFCYMIQVEQGAKVDMPLWLAEDLFHRQAALINLPSFFNQR